MISGENKDGQQQEAAHREDLEAAIISTDKKTLPFSWLSDSKRPGPNMCITSTDWKEKAHLF